MKYKSYQEGREKQILSCYDDCLLCNKESHLVEGFCQECWEKEKAKEVKE